jgi:hypothetical protein
MGKHYAISCTYPNSEAATTIYEDVQFYLDDAGMLALAPMASVESRKLANSALKDLRLALDA